VISSIVETAVGVMIPCMAACAKVVSKIKLSRGRKSESRELANSSGDGGVESNKKQKPQLDTIDRMLSQFQPSDRDADSGLSSGNVSKMSHSEEVLRNEDFVHTRDVV
jgi:hypothetical protein